MIFDTSAMEQTHGFALFLRCWWMEARDIPAGLRQSVTLLVYKLCTDMLFQHDWRLHFENSFVQSSEFFMCKLWSKKRVPSDHAGMKNVSAEVYKFCVWTNWIHFATCSKKEFRELHCCSRCALDKILQIYTFDGCPQGQSGQKSFLACGDAKKENWRTTKLFLKHMS